MSTGPSAPLSGPGLDKLRASAQTAKLHKTARQFEALFVTRLLEQMNKTTLSSGLFGKGVENDIYQSFMNEAVAEKVSSRGGMGIASMLERTLARKTDPASGDPHPGAKAVETSLKPDASALTLASVPPDRTTFAKGPSKQVPAELIRSPEGMESTRRSPFAGHGLGSLSAEIEMDLSGDTGGAVPESPAIGPTASGAAAEVPKAFPGIPAASRIPRRTPLIGDGSAPARAPGSASSRSKPVPRSAPVGAAFAPMVEKVARESGVEPDLLHAMLLTESGGRVRAVSPKGASGLMQLMPDTARAMGVQDVFDPLDNLRGGARYLAQLLKRFGGSVAKAVAAYNAGPTAVEKHGGVPPFPETRHYVREVLARRRDLVQAQGGRAGTGAPSRFD